MQFDHSGSTFMIQGDILPALNTWKAITCVYSLGQNLLEKIYSIGPQLLICRPRYLIMAQCEKVGIQHLELEI